MRPLEFNHDARSTNRQRGTDAQNSFPPRGPLNVFSTGRRLLPSPVPVISRNESKRTPIISISISASGGRPGSPLKCCPIGPTRYPPVAFPPSLSLAAWTADAAPSISIAARASFVLANIDLLLLSVSNNKQQQKYGCVSSRTLQIV